MSCYCQSTVAHPELPQRNKGCSSHHREAQVGRSRVATGRTEVSVACAGARLHRVGGGTAVQILTCHQVPDEESLVLFVVLQHALEVFLLSLDCDLSCEFMVPPVTLCQCLGS